MRALQRQVAKQAVLAPDPHAMGHEFEPPPAASRRPFFARDRKVSRLSSSFFGSLFFMDGFSFAITLQRDGI
jgi:hypothetical protein